LLGGLATAGFGQDTDNAVRITAKVPAQAEVWIGDQKMTQTGVDRQFVSPPLAQSDGNYYYEIRVRWQQADGQIMDRGRRVYFRPGDAVTIQFRTDREEAAARTGTKQPDLSGRGATANQAIPGTATEGTGVNTANPNAVPNNNQNNVAPGTNNVVPVPVGVGFPVPVQVNPNNINNPNNVNNPNANQNRTGIGSTNQIPPGNTGSATGTIQGTGTIPGTTNPNTPNQTGIGNTNQIPPGNTGSATGTIQGTPNPNTTNPNTTNQQPGSTLPRFSPGTSPNTVPGNPVPGTTNPAVTPGTGTIPGTAPSFSPIPGTGTGTATGTNTTQPQNPAGRLSPPQSQQNQPATTTPGGTQAPASGGVKTGNPR